MRDPLLIDKRQAVSQAMDQVKFHVLSDANMSEEILDNLKGTLEQVAAKFQDKSAPTWRLDVVEVESS